MAYDLNRCPQTEAEFKDYFFTLIQRSYGSACDDWRFVMTNSNIPPGFGPGVRADASYPLFGLTQQYSNGPKGRIFLPSDRPDENGYCTRCIQYLDDAAGTRARRAARELLGPGAARGKANDSAALLAEEFAEVKSGGLVWAWYYVAGNEYAPVQGAEAGGEGPIIIAPGGGLSREEIQAMIDTSINAALDPVYAALARGLKYGDKVALRIASGKIAGVAGGGSAADDQPIELITKSDIHAWESFVLEPGE